MIIEVSLLLGIYAVLSMKNPKNQEEKSISVQALQKVETISLARQQPSVQERKTKRYLQLSGFAVSVSALAWLFPALSVVVVAVLAFLSFPRFSGGMCHLFRHTRISNDFIIFIGILLGIVTTQYFALSLGMCLYYLAKNIQSKTRDHARQAIFELFDNKPRLAWLLKDGVEVEVSVDDIKIHDMIIIKAGEVVPVDAQVIVGEGIVDQSILTGESKPVEKTTGDTVLASTILLAGKIQARVEKTGTDTIIANIGKILNDSVEFKTEVQSKSEVWAEQSALPFLIMGSMAFPILGIGGATVIFRSTFSASIELIASLEVLSHLRYAYTNGIFIKDGRALEKLHDVDTILFDKTGTLTKGTFSVMRIIAYDSQYLERTILRFAAIAEYKLNHPIAAAIVDKAKEYKLEFDIPGESQYFIGYGVTVDIQDKSIKVGSERFMQSNDIQLPEKVTTDMQAAHDAGHSFVLVAESNRVVGAIELQAVLRDEVHQIITEIKKMGGRETYIVSGDHQQATAQMAKLLQIDNYYADVLPEKKAQIVENLQQQGKTVCFVGDGVNDSIAMNKADVSISLRGASSVATDVAQVIFMDGSLTHFSHLFSLSTHLNRKLRNGLFYTMTPSGFNIASAIFLHANLLTAILVDYGFLMSGLIQTMKKNKIDFIDNEEKYKLETHND